jgi:hypothetical protein
MFVIPISLATALSWMVVPAIILGGIWLLAAIATGMGNVRSRTPAQVMALNRRPVLPVWVMPAAIVLGVFLALAALH